MTSLLSVLPVVLRRFAANLRLHLAIFAGAILAAALLSTTSIYTGAIRDLGLSFAISESGPISNDITVRSSSQTTEADVYQQNRAFIDDIAVQTVGDLIENRSYMGRSATFFLAPAGEQFPEEDSRPRSHLQFLAQLEENIRLVDGRLPENAGPSGEQAPSVEVVVGAETAGRLDIAIGDSFDLFAFWKLEVPPVRVTVVGVIEPIDPNAVYWRGIDNIFSFFASGWDTMPFFVTEETFFDAVGGYLPEMSSTYWTFLYLETSRVDARDADALLGSLQTFSREMSTKLTRTTTETALPSILESFDKKLFFTRIPLLVLILQVAAIVLYYLFMVSTMLIERQSGEIALLKSRGATTPQVMQIYAIEGLFVFMAASAVGPPLAAAVISVLGHTPAFDNLTGGASLSVRPSSEAYLWAAGGAILAYVTLLLPAYLATRRTVVQQRTAAARPAKAAFITRYYFDVVFAALCGLLIYQLDRNGSLSTEDLFGGQTVDLVRLLTPAVFILAVALVFLRLFPLALRGVAWLVARSQGSAVLIGMWHLVRNPVHYSRLVLLLMLATAVGTFAASFGATLDRSYEDRAAFQSGSRLRLSDLRSVPSTGPDTLLQDVIGITGATDGTSVVRASGIVSPVGSGFSTTSFDLLGVDGVAISGIGVFRDDFGPGPMDTLLAKTTNEPAEPGEVLLPADARWIGVWINPVDLRGRAGIVIELKDATGRFFNYLLGPRRGASMPDGWHFAIADLTELPTTFSRPQFSASPPVAPMSVRSISIDFRSRFSANQGTLLLDDLQTSSQASLALALAEEQIIFDPLRESAHFIGGQVVIDFDSIDEWQTIQGNTIQGLRDELRSVPTEGGGSAAEISWRPSGGLIVTHGIQPKLERLPIPILVNDAFLDEAEVTVGETFNVAVAGSFFDVTVADSFDLFPTLDDPLNTPAILIDRESLLAVINNSATGSQTYANEIWLAPAAESTQLARAAVDDGRLGAQIVSFDELRLAQEEDPLVAAGWEGILFISFAAILLLSVIGFLIYSYLTAQQRTLEFAVLRTIGFSNRQIAIVVGFEQALVIALGMGAGTLMGLRLGTLLIQYMGVSETGDDVIPPMLLHVSWSTLGSAWFALGAAFLITIGVVVLLYSRLALHRVLRIGES